MSDPRPSPRPDLRVRVLTGVVAGVATTAVVLGVEPRLAFIAWLAVVTIAAVEFVNLCRHFAPSAPLGVLWWAVPTASAVGYWAIQRRAPIAFEATLAGIFAIIVVACLTHLWGRGELRDAAIGAALVALAIPYFAIPVIAIFRIHLVDRWLLLLLLMIVAAGDTFAYFVGRALGRRPLAPRISPKKTWEGTIGGFVGSVLVTAIWSQWRLGVVRTDILAVAAATAILAPLGDLFESLMKRGAGVKDSSQALPGHGGFYDRLDSLILAAPTFLIGVWWVGFDAWTP